MTESDPTWNSRENLKMLYSGDRQVSVTLSESSWRAILNIIRTACRLGGDDWIRWQQSVDQIVRTATEKAGLPPQSPSSASERTYGAKYDDDYESDAADYYDTGEDFTLSTKGASGDPCEYPEDLFGSEPGTTLVPLENQRPKDAEKVLHDNQHVSVPDLEPGVENGLHEGPCGERLPELWMEGDSTNTHPSSPRSTAMPSPASQSNWWYRCLSDTGSKQGVRYSPGDRVETRIVGVTFEGRQKVVAQLSIKEQVWLRREPHNPHDGNAIRVERQNGQQIGYIGREIAAVLASHFDNYGEPVPAVVTALVGEDSPYSNRGVRIAFNVPKPLPPVDDGFDEIPF
jgi:hypothetical protein